MEERGGGPLSLPPGFRFHPTDEELIEDYLRRRLHSGELRDSWRRLVVKEGNVYVEEPQKVYERVGQYCFPYREFDTEMYFFSPRRRAGGGGLGCVNVCRTVAGGLGVWDGGARAVQIKDADSGEVIGVREQFTYHHLIESAGGTKRKKKTKTDWLMHEYRLPPSPDKHFDELVLCRIYHHKKGQAQGSRAASNKRRRLDVVEDPAALPLMSQPWVDDHTAAAASSSSFLVTSSTEEGVPANREEERDQPAADDVGDDSFYGVDDLCFSLEDFAEVLQGQILDPNTPPLELDVPDPVPVNRGEPAMDSFCDGAYDNCFSADGSAGIWQGQEHAPSSSEDYLKDFDLQFADVEFDPFES